MNDIEQSAYNELFEFDRKLRTGKYAQQLEALAALPLFMEHIQGFPLVISTAFLRFTDFFCSAPNELRCLILQALKACFHYAGNIDTHADEIIRRLGVVWESNDVMAKSMVVRFYGLLAEGIVDRAEALYRVQQSLTSEYDEEVDAAIFAVSCFVTYDAKRVIPFIADAALRVLRSSSIYSNRLPKILKVFTEPTFDSKTESLILQQLKQFQLDDRSPAAAVHCCIKAIQTRLGIEL